MPWPHRVRHYLGLAGVERKLDRLLGEFPFTSIERAFEAIAPSRTLTTARAS
jgi:hypothetical protein